MTAENLHHVKRLAEGCGCVVVSAPGRCADGEKVTDVNAALPASPFTLFKGKKVRLKVVVGA